MDLERRTSHRLKKNKTVLKAATGNDMDNMNTTQPPTKTDDEKPKTRRSSRAGSLFSRRPSFGFLTSSKHPSSQWTLHAPPPNQPPQRSNTTIRTSMNRKGKPVQNFGEIQELRNERNRTLELRRLEPSKDLNSLSLREKFARYEFLHDIQTASLSNDAAKDVGVALPMPQTSVRKPSAPGSSSSRVTTPDEAPQVAPSVIPLHRSNAVRGRPEERRARAS